MILSEFTFTFTLHWMLHFFKNSLILKMKVWSRLESAWCDPVLAQSWKLKYAGFWESSHQAFHWQTRKWGTLKITLAGWEGDCLPFEVLSFDISKLHFFCLTCPYDTSLLLAVTILNCLWGITSSWRQCGLPAPKIPQHFGRGRSAAGGIQETACTSRETLWFVDNSALFKWGLTARDMAEIDSCSYLDDSCLYGHG